ncbi:MAG: hypothetical protein COT74_09340 [Bdellovibrionales bacterium CG10_big_fil_rev_8_21_14_0_10_45_34]|nr:MAG: hypothetical protein COT74_09340 [Bdellovibrionales bacterium CG10_big_fil_rev_8_21_14_0_10_45_34]
MILPFAYRIQSSMTDQERLFHSALRILARRAHSRWELHKKLSTRAEQEVVLSTLQRLEDEGWLEDENEIALRFEEELHRKNKSHRYIAQKMSQRGLSQPAENLSKECEKIRNILKDRLPEWASLDYNERTRLMQKLVFKGFSHSAIKLAVKNEGSYEEPRG